MTAQQRPFRANGWSREHQQLLEKALSPVNNSPINNTPVNNSGSPVSNPPTQASAAEGPSQPGQQQVSPKRDKDNIGGQRISSPSSKRKTPGVFTGSADFPDTPSSAQTIGRVGLGRENDVHRALMNGFSTPVEKVSPGETLFASPVTSSAGLERKSGELFVNVTDAKNNDDHTIATPSRYTLSPSRQNHISYADTPLSRNISDGTVYLSPASSNCMASPAVEQNKGGSNSRLPPLPPSASESDALHDVDAAASSLVAKSQSDRQLHRVRASLRPNKPVAKLLMVNHKRSESQSDNSDASGYSGMTSATSVDEEMYP